MSTNREVIIDALRLFQGLAPGDDLNVDEIDAGLTAITNVIRDIHASRGPLKNVDVTADYTAGENERVRVQTGYTVSVTCPNSIIVATGEGTSASADEDEATYRAPYDGTRIEIVGTSQDLRFYRADTNEWVSCGSLSIDGSMPLSAEYRPHIATMVAMALIDTWPAAGSIQPTPHIYRREGMARLRLMHQPGRVRTVLQAEYF